MPIWNPRSVRPRAGFLLPCLVVLAGLAVPGDAASTGQDVADEVFYHFMPIAWRDSDGDAFRFGDFGGMTDSLPYLSSLGVTAVWMNPVFPSPAYHGYQHGRGDQLNPWFGDEADFVAFITAAHAVGIKVFVDFVAYGISFDSPWFADAYGNPASPYDDWLAFTDGGNTQYQGSFYNTWNGDGVGHIWWDLRNPEAVALVTDWSRHWLDPNGDGNFSDGLDGYRLDHVWPTYPYGPDGWGYHIDSFWAPWRDALRAVNPDVFVFGEQADWGSQGIDLLGGLDAAFTKPFEFGARDALRWEYAEPLYGHVAAATAALAASPEPGTLLATIGNHDVGRLASDIGDDFAKGKAAAAVLLTQPFPPVIYHGDEIGMRGSKNTSYSGDAADIPMREPFKWNAVAGPPMSDYHVLNAAAYAGRISRDHDGRSVAEQDGVPGSLLETYRELIALRRAHVALRRGGYRPVPASDGAVWSFVRDHADQQALVVVNLSGGAFDGTLDLAAFGIPGGFTQPVDLLGGPGPVALTDANKDAWPVDLPAYGCAVYDLEVIAPAAPVSVVDGSDLPAAYGAGGLRATQDSPTHLGDNVSELDQLFVRTAGDSLFIGLTGNLATDGTGLALLLDTGPGGQNVLATGNLSPPPAGPDLLDGLALDPGFAPDLMYFLNAWAGAIYVDRYELPAGSGAVKSFVGQGSVGGGSALLTGGVNPGGLQVALDNRNTAGVTAGDTADAATAVSGCEWYLPLADLGVTAATVGEVRLAAFLLSPDGTVSNQWLPPVGGLAGPLGPAPDLATVAGDQFVAVGGVSAVAERPTGLTARVSQGRDGGVTIAFSLAAPAPVSLAVMDLRGRLVRRLAAGGVREAGHHALAWDGRDGSGRTVASGLYLFRLQAGPASAGGRIVLVR